MEALSITEVAQMLSLNRRKSLTHEQIAEYLQTTVDGLKSDIYRYRNGKTVKKAIHSYGYKDLLDKIIAGEIIGKEDLEKVDQKMLFRQKKAVTTTGLTLSQIAKVINLSYYNLYEDLKAYKKGKVRSRAKLNSKYKVVLDNLAYGVAVEYGDIKDLNFGAVVADRRPIETDDKEAVKSILDKFDKWSKKDDLHNHRFDSMNNGRLLL